LIDDARGRRVGELLGVVWLLALSDLVFTIWAHRFTHFFELNPIARMFLQQDWVTGLILFKVAVTLFGTIVLWRVRHYRTTEWAMCAATGVYVQLMFRWATYTLMV
jgi:hypothetical protein